MNKYKIVAFSLMAGIFAQLFAVQSASASEAGRPPNILLIVTDDQRWDELGVVQREQGADARFPFLETPRLDELAAEGMRFRNAFVTTSLCSPSRSAILTGQYNHTNGIIDNFVPFSPRPTWATGLQAAGYATVYVGKWHHGDTQWERPGFDYVATYPGHGRYNDTTFQINDKWWRTKTEGYVDERSVDFAVEFLEDFRDRPFAMMVGLKAPHQPFTPMQEHAEDYISETVQPSPNWNAVAPWKSLATLIPPRKPPSPPSWTDHLRTIRGVDKNVGRLLDALDELELADNTLVIFTSDNGFYFGEHLLGDKRSAYEESIRVPLLVRLPGRINPETVSDELVLNIDLAPTIMDIAVENAPEAMQGSSMRPLLSQTSVDWREAFLYEYWQGNTFWLPSRRPRTPSILAVRTRTHKLITYPDYGKWTQLFDLEADPYETRNLVGYDRAIHRHIEMCDLLQQVLAETDFVGRPSLNKWLLGLTDSYYTMQSHDRMPEIIPRPPLFYPNC